MLTALRNNKSLTFYQTTEFRPKFSVDSSYTGGITATGVFSTVQFVKLVCKGESLKAAAIQVGKQALFSLSLLVVSITAQGIFGGPSGIIVSVGVGVIFVTYTIADTVHQRNYSEKLRVYMIEKCKPIFA